MNKEEFLKKSEEHREQLLKKTEGGDLSNNKITVDEIRRSMTKKKEDFPELNEAISHSNFEESHREKIEIDRKKQVFGKLAHLMSRPTLVDFTLPCGYIYFGEVYKDIKICRMLGSEKRRLQAMATKGNVFGFKDSIITSSLVSVGNKFYNVRWYKEHGKKLGLQLPKEYEEIDSKFLDNLSIPDKTYITWQALMLGSSKSDGSAPVTISIKCPVCEKENNIKYDMSKVEFTTAEDKELELNVEENCWVKRLRNDELGIEILFRIADGEIQNEMLKYINANKVEKGLEKITDYSILEINGINRDDLNTVQEGLTVSKFLDLASDDVIDWIDFCIGNITPSPNSEIEFNCTHCGTEIKKEVNVESFLLKNNYLKKTQRGKD